MEPDERLAWTHFAAAALNAGRISHAMQFVQARATGTGLSAFPTSPSEQAAQAAEYADAMLEEWRKRVRPGDLDQEAE